MKELSGLHAHATRFQLMQPPPAQQPLPPAGKVRTCQGAEGRGNPALAMHRLLPMPPQQLPPQQLILQRRSAGAKGAVR